MRGAGPELVRWGVNGCLADWGVSGVLADPRLDVFKYLPDQSWQHLATNQDWDDGTGAGTPTFRRIGAFDFTSGSNDAAFLLRLSPRVYAAHCSGFGGATGVALIEVYEVDA